MKIEDIRNKEFDVSTSLVNLLIENHATNQVILDLLIDVKSKLDNKPKEEIEEQIGENWKKYQEEALNFLHELRDDNN